MSRNFDYLGGINPDIARVAAEAEKVFSISAEATLSRLRCFAEAITIEFLNSIFGITQVDRRSNFYQFLKEYGTY